MPNSRNHSFIEPQQERSRKRFEEVLKTAEFIYKNQDDYDLTVQDIACLLYTSPSPRDRTRSRMPSSA